jgi:cytochrome c oxidase subunit IV
MHFIDGIKRQTKIIAIFMLMDQWHVLIAAYALISPDNVYLFFRLMYRREGGELNNASIREFSSSMY